MKKTIYILGILSCMIIAGGIFMKINHLKFAGMTITIGISSLILLFLPLALINNYKNASTKPGIGFYLITYLTCFVLYTTTLFKIQHWSGSSIMLMIGIPIPFVLFLPVLIYYSRKEEVFKINQTIIMIFLLAYISVMTAMLGLSVSHNVLFASLRVGNQIQKTNYSMVNQLNKTDKNDLSALQDLSMTREGKHLFRYIEGYKNTILETVDNRNIEIARSNNNLMDFYGLEKRVTFDGSNNEELRPETLKKELHNYDKYLNSVIPNENLNLKKLVSACFDTKNIEIEGREILWEDYYFSNIQAVWLISILSQFQTDILLVESELAQTAS